MAKIKIICDSKHDYKRARKVLDYNAIDYKQKEKDSPIKVKLPKYWRAHAEMLEDIDIALTEADIDYEYEL